MVLALVVRQQNSNLSKLTNPPGHLWRDKWTALSGPLLLGDLAVELFGEVGEDFVLDALPRFYILLPLDLGLLGHNLGDLYVGGAPAAL